MTASIPTMNEITIVLFLLSPTAFICDGDFGFISSSLLSIMASNEAQAVSMCRADDDPLFAEPKGALDDDVVCGGISDNPRQ